MPKSRLLDYARVKLESLKAHIDEVAREDFAHSGGQNALEILKTITDDYVTDIDRLAQTQPIDEAAAIALCEEVNAFIVEYLPVIGIIKRSTEILNSFEFFDPLIRISHSLLDAPPASSFNLILFSEWHFSPMIYPMCFDKLPNFLFIGLPVSEAGNSLVIPLAGHEIGHAVWRKYAVAQKVPWLKKIEEIYIRHKDTFKQLFGIDFNIGNLSSAYWRISMKYAQSQAEEVFCDALGVTLFRSSFLNSMEYLLAPSWGGRRSYDYPSNEKRAEILKSFGEKLGCKIPENFLSIFKANGTPLMPITQQDQFILDRADEVTNEIAMDLFAYAQEIVRDTNVQCPDDSEIAEILKYLSRNIPAIGSYSLGSIVCAAWERRSAKPPISIEPLSEIVLKTIEISEINQRTAVLP